MLENVRYIRSMETRNNDSNNRQGDRDMAIQQTIDTDAAFDLLAANMEGKGLVLPREDGYTMTTAHSSEFMLMSNDTHEVHSINHMRAALIFKHRDSRNYLWLVNEYGGWQVVIPQEDAPFYRGQYALNS